MSIAFVIQTYKGLEQVERLARTLAAGATDPIVVITHRGTEADRNRLAAAEGVDHVLPSPGGRGRFAVIDGLISAMRWLERQPKPFRWIVVLSGQDYPIRPLSELEAELSASDLDGYLHHFDAMNLAAARSGPMSWTPRLVDQRYHFQYATLKETPTRFERMALLPIRMTLELLTRRINIHSNFAIMVGKRAREMPFSPDFKLYGGSYWMTISRRAGQAVLDFVDQRPDVVDYFRQVICPEESFIQSVIANDRGLKLTTRELRHVEFDWTNYGWATELRMADLPRVLASERYIARKFDFERQPELAEALDEIVLPRRTAVDSRPASAAAANVSA